MDTSASYHDEQGAHGRAVPYMVSVLLEDRRPLDPPAVMAALAHRLGPCTPMPADAGSTIAREIITHMKPAGRDAIDGPDAPAVMAVSLELPNAPDHVLPPGLLLLAHPHTDDFNSLRHAVSQTWDWPDAGAVVNRHTACVTLVVVAPPGLPRPALLEVAAGGVRALLDCLPVTAIHWLPAQRVIEPAPWRDAADNGAVLDAGAINVRLFHLEGGRPDETVMDTMGLAAFGLPDLQCHFVRLDPNAVGQLLYDYAAYVFHNGPVIGDGDSLQGVPARDGSATRWVCRHEPSLINPTRAVLDLIPGDASPMFGTGTAPASS
ncbi:MAG: DUF4261 domain-containing protein [Planctomycetota bacterium]